MPARMPAKHAWIMHGSIRGKAVMELKGTELSCVRGGRRVFTGVNFTVESSKSMVLTGANGAGKSSVLRLVAGLIRPEEGTLALIGGGDELTVGEQAHYVGHLDPLKPALTVMENLTFWVCFLNGEAPPGPVSAAQQGLEAVGLDELGHLPAGYLSAGQRRRLSLARMLAVPRPIWLLDEPTTALDAASQQRLQRVMHTHLSAGGLIIAATHGPLGLAQPGELPFGTPSTGPKESCI